MTETIISATENEGEVSILISAQYAEDYYTFLKKLSVNCSRPKPAIFQSAGITFGQTGKAKAVWKTSDCEITAPGTIKDFNGWTNAWLDR